MKTVAHLSVVLVFATLILAVPANGAAQTNNPCDTPNNLPPSFFVVPEGPQGTWTASVSPDIKQAEDPSVPVVVDSAGAIQGPASHRGMRLGCGSLRNQSQKTVTAVRLRWILVRRQDRPAIAQQGYTRDTVLIEGATPAIELSIAKGGFRQTDFSLISFALVTQPLSKNGLLTGDYVLIVGVKEIVFDDGSIWTAEPILR